MSIFQIEVFETDIDGFTKWKEQINAFQRAHPGALVVNVVPYENHRALVAIVQYEESVSFADSEIE